MFHMASVDFASSKQNYIAKHYKAKLWRSRPLHNSTLKFFSKFGDCSSRPMKQYSSCAKQRCRKNGIQFQLPWEILRMKIWDNLLLAT